MANLQTAYKMCRGDGDTSAIIRKNEILGHAFIRVRIQNSPTILKRTSAGLRIKCDVGTEMSSTLYAKMWFCGASSQDLRIISCKRNGTIRNFAILKCISADLRIISNKRNQFIRKCRI